MSQTPKKFNLSDWLAWMEQCHSSEIDLGLERISQVAKQLQIDLSDSVVVTVAGTNGKGSTVSYLNQIYLSAGHSVGCFTSPHFLRYNERVRLNGEEATDALLCDAFEKIDQARGQIPLTYFEFGTLAALLIFSEQKPELVLLEVGLGGRLDAVNIIDADIAIVTTVALDHIDWLGDNREKIGREKAGIFRSQRPAICGDLEPPASVAAYAENIGAELLQAGVAFSFCQGADDWSWQGVSPEGEALKLDGLALPALPLQNASTVLQAVQYIPLSVSESQLRQALSQATLTGRMQRVEQDGVTYWLDVAHNPEAAELLARRIQALPGDKLLILGMLADKDCKTVIELLAPCVDQSLLVDINVPRGQKAAQLARYFPEQVKTTEYTSVAEALVELKKHHKGVSNVIIAGSFFTVTDALSALGKEK